MKLLIQPGAGLTPLVKAIDSAKKSVEIFIFRCDRSEIERALENAVRRGVFVHALIAYTNRGGNKSLRKLELRLLAKGVTVGRTNDDLLRYHAKLLIVDRSVLYLLAFNFTYLDIEHSRTFGVIAKNRALVQEAARLFEADSRRRPYHPRSSAFVISPENARAQLASFIEKARKELLIYDVHASDPAMLRLLEARAAKGLSVRMIGSLKRKSSRIVVRRSPIRLHARTMVRDGDSVFIGSQGLREVELDARREVGIIFKDRTIARKIARTFHADWTAMENGRAGAKEDAAPPAAAKVAKKVAKAIAKDLPPVVPMLRQAMKDVGGDNEIPKEVDRQALESTVKDVVKEAVKQAVRDVVEEAAAEHMESEPEKVEA